jgi:acetyl-CoA acetyltransferase
MSLELTPTREACDARTMSAKTYVLGAAMAPFKKPGQHDPYPVSASTAVNRALEDARIEYEDVNEAYAGYCLADSTAGQRALYEVATTGIPIFNVHNNCSTGSTALMLARRSIEAGAIDCALVVGFEEMPKRPGPMPYADKASPIELHVAALERIQGKSEAPIAAQLFGGAGREHQQRFGTKKETFAKVSAKARRHAKANPYAIFSEPLTIDEILASPMIFEPLTRLMCCPMTCGAAAVVLASERFARARSTGPRVRILSQSMTTDTSASFDAKSAMKIVGYDMTRAAAADAYAKAGLGPDDVDVVELHDCFATNEVLSYEALGLCDAGGAEKLIEDGDNTYGGRWVVNPSGGLLSKGHPIGATGVAQCVELTWQLRGQADKRQVESAKIALQHNLGLGGACVVTLYGRE